MGGRPCVAVVTGGCNGRPYLGVSLLEQPATQMLLLPIPPTPPTLPLLLHKLHLLPDPALSLWSRKNIKLSLRVDVEYNQEKIFMVQLILLDIQFIRSVPFGLKLCKIYL